MPSRLGKVSLVAKMLEMAGVTEDDVVYDLLSMIYTDEGLAHMRQQKKTFKEMAVETGINGIVTPLHPGAEKFWKEKGMLK